MKNCFLIILISLITTCCTNNRKLTIQFENAEGLTTESKVYLNGISIGEVEDIELHGNKILVEINLKTSLPIDSKFQLIETSLLGSSGIKVVPGNSRMSFTGKETVIGNINSGSVLDTFNSKANKVVNELLTSSEKKDSILYELRRLK